MKFLRTFLAALLAVVTGSFLTGFIWLLVLAGIAAGSLQSNVYVHPHSILKIDFAEDINDRPVVNPLSQIDFTTLEMHPSLSLYKALCAIDAAKSDDRIQGIYIRPTGAGSVSLSTLEELRAALAEFSAESGKFVVAYNETYDQPLYYFASVADKVYLQPEGGMMWQGLGFNLAFYKGMLDKLGIRVEVFRPTACKYKSAVEPYILTKMSDENRRQMTELAASMWSTITEAVSQSRGIEVAKLNEAADRLAVTLPEDAVAAGFVDGLLYEDQMNAVFGEYGAEAGYDGLYKFVSLGDYASQVGIVDASKNKIAVIYAEGQIYDGYGDTEAVYGNSLAEQLAEARRDQSVKAVILRVNSPGGSALASNVVWRETELLKAEKPLIVSMGSYAASGGYYISAAADAIVADRMTLTGSIGVFGLIPDAGKLFNDKLGITFDGGGTNKYALNDYFVRPMSAVEKSVVMREVDKVYDTFTHIVAEGRNLPLERVLDIAGGRVWSGTDAEGNGLVDACGGLKMAIAAAADKAALGNDFSIKEITEHPQGIAALLSSLDGQIRERALRNELGALYGSWAKAREVLGQRGVAAYCPYEIVFY